MKTYLYAYKFKKCKLLKSIFASKRCISYFGKWEQPQGYDSGIYIYNSAVNKKVPLILKRKDLATWYMCGPTVYAESHIGHASCYVKFDIIRRVMENMFNINVFLLLGITDIDDKIIRKSRDTGMSAVQLARKFELEFLQDMKSMRVLPPTLVSRVTENIPLIISFCQKLIESKFAYATKEGNVYFMVSKGTSADVLTEIQENVLTEKQTDPLKQDPRDFALWKAVKPNEPSWQSPWGQGRPGWHIECSAMATKVFGSELDLHSGGYDLLFPHHVNEKSQSEAFHGCSQWVNYWLHSGLLQIDENSKMSKSLGNSISIKDFLQDNCVNDFRILCLQFLYRKNLFYNDETLSGAKSIHKKIHNFINECELYINGEIRGSIPDADKILSVLTSTKEQVRSCLANDFNTSQALLCLTDFMDEVNRNLSLINASGPATSDSISTIASCYFYVNKILDMLGISIVSKKNLPEYFISTVDATVEFRNKIRVLALNPKEENSEEGQTCVFYMDDAYQSLTLKVDMIWQSKNIPRCIADIIEVSRNIYEDLYKFAEKMDSDKTFLHNPLEAKEARKKKAPLLNICDEFRSSLLECGIGIKDRSNSSTWIPMIELQKILTSL